MLVASVVYVRMPPEAFVADAVKRVAKVVPKAAPDGFERVAPSVVHQVDVPVSALSGEGLPGGNVLCMLFGSSTPFDSAKLSSLYPTQDDYLERFDAALDATIAAGFVRAQDRDAYAAEARANFVP